MNGSKAAARIGVCGLLFVLLVVPSSPAAPEGPLQAGGDAGMTWSVGADRGRLRLRNRHDGRGALGRRVGQRTLRGRRG